MAAVILFPNIAGVDNSMPLPLKFRDGHIHVHITVPFSLIVRDFGPNTSPPRTITFPRSPRWATLLLGPHHHTLPEPASGAGLVAGDHLEHFWPQLSLTLFGREMPAQYTLATCDAADWEHLDDSNVFWTTAGGAIVDTPNPRVLTLKGHASPVGGGIRFTLEEMGGERREAWKVEYARAPLHEMPGAPNPAVAGDLIRRNLTPNRLMSGRIRSRAFRKDSFESSTSSADGKAFKPAPRRPAGLWCFKG